MKYRKKPIVIEAVKYLGVNKAFNLFNEYPEWLTKAINTREIGLSGENNNLMGIKTLEGHVWASPGDYIIQGINGELYPCKPDIFEKTYDCAEEYHEAWNRIIVAPLLEGLPK